jgi:hypothetical protein
MKSPTTWLDGAMDTMKVFAASLLIYMSKKNIQEVAEAIIAETCAKEAQHRHVEATH